MRVLREILYGVVLCGGTAWGQWIDCTNGTANNKQCVSTGNVGLGTATPSSLLHLLTPAPSGTAYPILTLGASGSLTGGRLVGPVTSGGEQLYLTKNLLFNPAVGWVSDSTSGNAGMIALDGSSWPYPIAFYVSAAGSNPRTLKSAMQIDTSANVVMNGGGNVAIGTSSAQYKLTVNGTIGAKEVIVTNGISADYVFKPGYRLRPLPEVAAFIKAHQHLPEVPSVRALGRSLPGKRDF